tara:strand:+ start:105 stop:431 length:327 start_codon:yes stop_codon:yes gene_type:complete
LSDIAMKTTALIGKSPIDLIGRQLEIILCARARTSASSPADRTRRARRDRDDDDDDDDDPALAQEAKKDDPSSCILQCIAGDRLNHSATDALCNFTASDGIRTHARIA